MQTIEISRTDDQWTATDTETGVTASGDSRAGALRTLAEVLEASESTPDAREQFTELAADTRERFADEDVSQSAVEDAIERARS